MPGDDIATNSVPNIRSEMESADATGPSRSVTGSPSVLVANVGCKSRFAHDIQDLAKTCDCLAGPWTGGVYSISSSEPQQKKIEEKKSIVNSKGRSFGGQNGV